MLAPCPTCRGDRNSKIHGSTKKTGSFDAGGVTEHYWKSAYLLECCGCETIYYCESYHDTLDCDYEVDRRTGEETIVYDKKTKTFPTAIEDDDIPAWVSKLYRINPILSNIMLEVYAARKNNCLVLSAIGLRTALDTASDALKIDPAITMEEKLDKLLSGGWIGETEHLTLKTVVNAGNAAAHRGWVPVLDELQHLVMTLEGFIHRTFIIGKNALGVEKSIPPKQKRLKTPAVESVSST